jgi:aspartyl-tRNA(Asn)/glutamyl-tRNA(Gln) amidotransferase subunit A
MSNLIGKTIKEYAALILRREVSCKELVQAHLDHIAKTEQKIQAFIEINENLSLARAEELDKKLENEPDIINPLYGIPMAVKDVICTKGVKTTAASKILENFIPPYDATVITRLRALGAVMLGKTNCDEFAMGSSTEFSAFKSTRNPWDPEKVPGGSSGGSAASVASGECVYSLGSDTGGSIRQPAALCGVVGLKPTYGRVSRFGLIAFASSLDQIGPFARCVDDCFLVFEAISGWDKKDATSAAVEPFKLDEAKQQSIKGKRIGIAKEYFGQGVDSSVADLVHKAVDELALQGASIIEISLPHTDLALSTYYVLAPAEASSNLARYDGVRYGVREEQDSLYDMYTVTRKKRFGKEVKRRIMLGTYTLSAGYYDAYYLQAQKIRTLIRQDFDNAFENCDLIAGPTSPSVAFDLGSKLSDPLTMYMCDILTVPASLAGVPAVSVPCGTVGSLPVGIQFIAPPFREDLLYAAAHAVEEICGMLVSPLI